MAWLCWAAKTTVQMTTSSSEIVDFMLTAKRKKEREWAERKVNTIRARSQQLKRERKEVCVCECECECEWEGNVRAKAPVEMCMRHNALPLRVCYTN